MDTVCEWAHKIFSVNSVGFEPLTLEIFRYQYGNNPVYKAFVDALRVIPSGVQSVYQVPFLPISFFKTQQVKIALPRMDAIFESSGTTQTGNSRHFVQDLSIYEKSFTNAFDSFYGAARDWCIIGLLPSYLERGNSSLVYMVDKLIQQSNQPESGFYLSDYGKLRDTLAGLEKREQKTLLIGVTFALLDFADRFSFPLKHTVLMETGGMKGRRREMIRTEVHDYLKKSFSIDTIHSEYGMTELLSQAYSAGNGIFKCPPWMKIVLREEDDPLHVQRADGNIPALRGALNVVDLANVFSCSFIATDDVGKLFADGSFEVQGRIDNSDIRGCNLLIA